MGRVQKDSEQHLLFDSMGFVFSLHPIPLKLQKLLSALESMFLLLESSQVSVKLLIQQRSFLVIKGGCFVPRGSHGLFPGSTIFIILCHCNT
jgi:hypothetical protein